MNRQCDQALFQPSRLTSKLCVISASLVSARYASSRAGAASPATAGQQVANPARKPVSANACSTYLRRAPGALSRPRCHYHHWSVAGRLIGQCEWQGSHGVAALELTPAMCCTPAMYCTWYGLMFGAARGMFIGNRWTARASSDWTPRATAAQASRWKQAISASSLPASASRAPILATPMPHDASMHARARATRGQQHARVCTR